jgi:uncharacterized protein (TIGR03435 family)
MQMVKAMLADRFGLEMTTEAKEMPVYDLVQSKKGARLHAVTDDGDQSRVLVNGGTVYDKERHSRMTMAAFAEMLQRHPSVGSPVIDKTGLTGSYTFTLNSSSYPRPPEDAPDLFIAIEDQLGLKLVRSRAQMTVYRVIRVNKPSPN